MEDMENYGYTLFRTIPIYSFSLNDICLQGVYGIALTPFDNTRSSFSHQYARHFL